MRFSAILGILSLLLTLNLFGCGAPCSCPTPPAEPEASSGGESDETQNTNPALAEFLELTCGWVTEAMANRSISLDDRMRGVEQRIRALPPEQLEIGRTFSLAVREADAGDDRYGASVRTAEAMGVPGYTCPALERAYQLRREQDQDLEPNLEADFQRWCEAAEDIEGSHPEHIFSSSDELHMILAAQLQRGVSHPTTWEIFRAIAQAPMQERYPLIVRGAEAEGLEGWSCPPLERLYQLELDAEDGE